MPEQTLQRAVTRMLRPLVRLLLRHGVAHATLSDWLKRLYVETAASDFTLEHRKPSISRIALVTGINRKEVRRVLDSPTTPESRREKHNRAARVIHGWRSDPDFSDDAGAPRPLPFSDGGNDFTALVKRYSGDIPARAVLDELLRTGIVARDDGDLLRLLKPGYVPCRSNDELLRIAGDSVRDLLETIDHNLQGEETPSRLQLSVAYDNLPAPALAAFRRLSRERAMALLTELDDFLAHHDRDSNPDAEGEGRYRAGVGIYYFEEDKSDEAEN